MATAKVVGISDLLASAFSSTLNSTVVTYEQYKKEESKPASQRNAYFEVLNVDQIFRLTNRAGHFGDEYKADASRSEYEIEIYIKTPSGMMRTIYVATNELVGGIKLKIQDIEGTPPDQQRLIYAGKQLEDDRSISEYNIQRNSTLHLVVRLLGGGTHTYYIDDSLLDPSYDYDFTGKRDDGTKYYRGGYEYHRPYGWRRYALKVLGRFGDDRWLGTKGHRAASCSGEWPVSYHGTGVNVSGNIAQEGYDLSKGRRFRYGRGIYSTSSVEVAAKYAQTFLHEGKRYQMVFQNRVSPTDLKIIDARTTGVGEYWVQPNQELIRPYGICIRPF